MSVGAWYAVVDTARDPRLYPLVRATAEHQCLISGEVAPVLAATLPYVVGMRAGEELADRWSTDGAGRAWGILAQSSAGIDALRLHFKKRLNAKLPDGAVVMFRFYDPVVFHRYLYAATPAERALWFGDVQRYVVEGESADAGHDFTLQAGLLCDRGAPVA